MAFSQADIDALKAAIASGERQVVLGGQSVTYRSISDLITALEYAQRNLDEANAAAGTTTRRPKVWYAYHGGRGY